MPAGAEPFLLAWPADWPLILAALGRHYGWAKADLEALAADEARFWHNAAAMLAERVEREAAATKGGG